ncbi:ribonuclease BN (plasmid) [Legionella adelaidensis]|uniref:UPF0761 membrane protein Lade_1256 n=1 Tax=Legionella adelaidensis TaxID=45056 RepID=A0A0W0R682_9GAMM|nr:YihY family inner membrane protein [Legionella adelaidensis]KTC66598.1 ribonuclease BN [Legionella adelaidensis]VEH85505.1 ribonuclease BN [Legionella adelaidensis]
MFIKQKLTTKYQECVRFICFVIDHFIEDDCTYRASALAFTTLLAIVPLMSVGLAILSSFPVFHDLIGPVQDFIFANFIPASGKIVQNYLQSFSTQVSKLSALGIIFLFITALLVMYTIERSMNKIWRVSNPRKGVSAFLLYWAILSLAPFFLGLSLAASSYVFSIPFIKGVDTPLLLSYIPILLSFVGFTFLYVIVPNCRVHLIHGLYGALVATILFEGAKQAFVYYLSRYNTYQLLYGAFATIPIFFIWVYWVWLITLLGAEISYALSVHHQRREGVKIDGLSHTLLWLHKVWEAHLQGKSVTLEELINVSSLPFAIDIGEMLNELFDLGLIKATDTGKYILSRDLNTLTLYELMQLLPYRLPTNKELKASGPTTTHPWVVHIKKAEHCLEKTLNVSLDELFRAN